MRSPPIVYNRSFSSSLASAVLETRSRRSLSPTSFPTLLSASRSRSFRMSSPLCRIVRGILISFRRTRRVDD